MRMIELQAVLSLPFHIFSLLCAKIVVRLCPRIMQSLHLAG